MNVPPNEGSAEQLPDHFNGKEAIEHVIEAQAQGIISANEIHGLEPPGSLSAACDAARETAILLPILAIILTKLQVSMNHLHWMMAIASFGWLIWKTGRGAWLAWFRLERLHRILEQERFEIEHHRGQERDELRVLYATKGFEGKLLEEVLDVLMADNDRLLKVMVEEELGLSLESHEHPLKQGLGSASGVLFAAIICLVLSSIAPWTGLALGVAVVISTSAAISAKLAQNKSIPAIVWNLGLAAFALSGVYFLMQLLVLS